MSAVKDLVKAKCSVRALLEHAEFDSALRDGRVVVDYLLQPTRMGELLDELMREPAPNSDAVGVFMRAVDVFKLDEIGDEIARVVLENKALVQRFTALFQRAPPISSGVFNANAQLLLFLTQRNVTRMVEHLKATKGAVVVALLNHLQQQSATPLIARLIELDVMGRTSQALADGNFGAAMLERLARSQECGADELCLCESIAAVVSVDLLEGRPIATAPLVRQMCEPNNARNLYNFALKSGKDMNARAEAGLAVINVMVRRCPATTPNAETAAVNDLPSPLRAAFGAIPQVVKSLRTYKSDKYFGCYRLAMVEFLCALASTGYRHLHTLLVDAGAFAVVFDIFFDRHWINFVHRLVRDLRYFIFYYYYDNYRFTN